MKLDVFLTQKKLLNSTTNDFIKHKKIQIKPGGCRISKATENPWSFHKNETSLEIEFSNFAAKNFTRPSWQDTEIPGL